MPFISHLLFYDSSNQYSSFDGTLFVNSQLVVACDTVITLSAVVTGSLSDRTIEWTQISGTPVVFLESTQQLSTTFTQSAVRDDKVFRFTIDEASEFRIFRDILVTAVPTERSDVSISGKTVEQNDYVPSETAQGIRVLPGFSTSGSATVNNTGLLLLWNEPIERYLSSYSLGTRQPDGTFSYTPIGLVRYTTPVVVGSIYKLSSQLDYLGVRRTGYSESYTVPNQSSFIDAADTGLISIGSNSNSDSQGILDTLVRELIGVDTVNDVSLMGVSSNTSSQIVLEEFTRSLIATDTPEDTGNFAVIGILGSQSIIQVLTTGITSLG